MLSLIFYNELNNDFKHYYNTPGEYISLYNYISNLKINFKDISIEEFIKNIINDNSFKNSTYLKDNLIKFIELFFLKKSILIICRPNKDIIKKLG